MSERVAGAPGERPDEGRNREELLRKYDAESAYRTNLGPWKWVVLVIGSALTIFQLYTALRGGYVFLIQGAIHVGAAMSLVYLLYPAKRAWSSRRGIPFYDLILAGLAIWTNSYIVINYERLTNQSVIFGFSTLDYTVAGLGVLLVLEATRRCVGLPIVVIAACALLYGWLGPYMPIFPHAGFSLERLATETFFTTSSIFGTPIQVSATFIYLFLFFGVLLVKTNIGQFFNDLAFALTGRYTGGTAKAAVVASGLQGTISGSSVANTVTSGSFTIPMMKRAGFRPEFSAAAEASASTGGQIMPPIMGAAAFIMAEYTGVPYNEIIVIAIIPAILYFTGVFTGTHFVAKRDGIVGVPRDQLPPVGGLLKKIYLALPLVVIIGMLLSGFSPQNSALYGIATAFLVSFLRSDTRMSLPEMGRLLENGARAALPVIAACATAGIIAGIVTKTGLGGVLAGGILDLALGNFFLLMFFTMIACLVLGMGLPTTANYVVTATVAAPILVQFDVPLIAAHFFVFYFGIVADITPPVCLAAYAGAGIAGANPMRTGVTAVSLAIAAFIIPYIFVTEPVLVLEGATFLNFAPAFLTAVAGMIAISGGIMGYFMGRANVVERLALVAGGIALVYPNLIVSLSGLALVVAIGVFQYLRGASGGKPEESTA
ncbi:TRAP transporter, 4TM/12TM fusion protein [Rubrobacter radiotolerans]|uniref:TRAP transporter permease n=1 Tax=Rubrobacter radiotolerans TaxID=42256 RepID=A0A023X5Q0_RUBRA|nr:TRAP transporter permease [Rubrobacter radiotolerans]AHY47802.1 TRAP transporter, 4TM/12TM fusion protein [Rubrobacter radiotolerans]MDX5892441.1 TRAP transporter permease [Rubrobacter radiotolerans]SMC07732.1 TRAP transporter, 4TM/12TM fusion protein [Rubrobacter radiotolerans DSM 5868]